jgi:hypothetical protein
LPPARRRERAARQPLIFRCRLFFFAMFRSPTLFSFRRYAAADSDYAADFSLFSPFSSSTFSRFSMPRQIIAADCRFHYFQLRLRFLSFAVSAMPGQRRLPGAFELSSRRHCYCRHRRCCQR